MGKCFTGLAKNQGGTLIVNTTSDFETLQFLVKMSINHKSELG